MGSGKWEQDEGQNAELSAKLKRGFIRRRHVGFHPNGHQHGAEVC